MLPSQSTSRISLTRYVIYQYTMRTCRPLVLTVIVLICWNNMSTGSPYVPNVNDGQQYVIPYDPRYVNQNPNAPNSVYEHNVKSTNVAVPVGVLMNGVHFNYNRPVSRQLWIP